jgi:2,3,4,5-tetrahydropyridine-2-carboxylate N-succinyltransferase
MSLAADIRALSQAHNSGQEPADPGAIQEQTGIDVRQTLDAFLDALETGEVRAAERRDGGWQVNEWVKQGVLLTFSLRDIQTREHGGTVYNDVLGLANTSELGNRGTRNTPDGTVVRRGANVGRDVILMSPSFVNIGATVGDGSLVDSCDTVGSCAQIGEGVKLGANSLVGGVLEPVEDVPVIVEDGVSLGAGCRVTSGFVVGENAVVGENTLLTPRIPVYDLVEERVIYGRLPPNRRAFTRYVESSVGDHNLFDGGAYKPAVVATHLEAETLEATAREAALRESS